MAPILFEVLVIKINGVMFILVVLYLGYSGPTVIGHKTNDLDDLSFS